MKLCWVNPSTNVDGTELTDLTWIRLYKDGLFFGEYPADAPGTKQCLIFRIPEGTYQFSATAMDAERNESAMSNTVQKTESRLPGPSEGQILRGPSDGTIITQGDPNGP